MIVDYTIITSKERSKDDSLAELVDNVRFFMKEHGWQPLGAPFYLDREYHRDGSFEVYAQAMVKYDA